jgi:ankyrin repeat protein
MKNLLSYNADPSVADCHGCTPLRYASMSGNIEVMRVLIAAGVPTDDGGSLQDPVENCN